MAEALDLFSKEPKSDSVEVEAKYFAEVVAPNDALLAARCKLAYICSRPAEASGGGRARLQQRSEQDALVTRIGKDQSMLRCKKPHRGDSAYVCVQYVLKAITRHDLHYILGAFAINIQRPQGIPAPVEFAGANLKESLRIKMERLSELYQGDLDIVAAYIIAVFAHDSCDGDYRDELRSRQHDPGALIEYFVTVFRQSFEPDVNAECTIVSNARTRIRQLYSFAPNRWTIELAYLYIDYTLQPLYVLRSKKWETEIMEEIAAMISLASAQTNHARFAAIAQLFHELDR